MTILCIRTDKPEAELAVYDNQTALAQQRWQAHRKLAETLHVKINEVLAEASNNIADIEGVVVYKGPGSFTGLRIGVSVANALAYSLAVPVIGTNGENWIEKGIGSLQLGESDETVIPAYGSAARTTKPRK